MSAPRSAAQAVACANIALAKYWGKVDSELNLPAVPSISLTLDKLTTTTRVEFDPSLTRDELWLDDALQKGSPFRRASRLLDQVRSEASLRHFARVVTSNGFPTASGLASSASGFAALAAAAEAAAGLDASLARTSRLARRASASAARSVYGGFVELAAGAPGDDGLAAHRLAPPEHWDVRLIVAITSQGPKQIGSTEAMERTRLQSPFYDAWVQAAPAWAQTIREGIAERDLEKVGQAMEMSTQAFHASAWAAGIRYWQASTLEVLERVKQLRAEGIGAWATMDAGPHVKLLCEARDAPHVFDSVRRCAGVSETLTARPGPDVSVRHG